MLRATVLFRQNSLPSQLARGSHFVIGKKQTVFVEALGRCEKMQPNNRNLADNSAKSARTQVSLIVPVFNEAPLIRPFLAHLRERAPGAEIIVADGGSTDSTAELAANLCDRLVQSQRSRAHQMNSGEDAAHGEILWFVHADAELPLECLDEIARIMHDSKVAGGYFRIRLPRGLVYR